jgi:hypothetical protein
VIVNAPGRLPRSAATRLSNPFRRFVRPPQLAARVERPEGGRHLTASRRFYATELTDHASPFSTSSRSMSRAKACASDQVTLHAVLALDFSAVHGGRYRLPSRCFHFPARPRRKGHHGPIAKMTMHPRQRRSSLAHVGRRHARQPGGVAAPSAKSPKPYAAPFLVSCLCQSARASSAISTTSRGIRLPSCKKLQPYLGTRRVGQRGALAAFDRAQAFILLKIAVCTDPWARPGQAEPGRPAADGTCPARPN